MTHVLYILMRNDLASMNAGKAMAQASHASNAFVYETNKYIDSWVQAPVDVQELKRYMEEWQGETGQGFGTVLVLEGSMVDFKPVVSAFKGLEYRAQIITDPTYPIIDGSVVHHVYLETCAYVFVPNKETDEVASTLLRRFSLHK